MEQLAKAKAGAKARDEYNTLHAKQIDCWQEITKGTMKR